MLPPGTRIGNRYQIDNLLGQGGMSNLYLAKDNAMGGVVRVIKEMTAKYADPNEQAQADNLFMREAELLSKLNHPNIPKVFDKFRFQGNYYLSMELVQGEDLGKLITKAGRPLPEVEVANYGSQMAAVLYYLHKQDPPIVFRDVKPSNIMICGDRVKLIDFGIARLFTPARKGDTMRIGSPGYAPPEQYSGQSDPRSDMYALGVTLHHALTGHDPTESNTPFLIPPAKKLNPALSDEMVKVLERSTQLDPDKRYSNMLEMRRELQNVLRLHGVQVGASTPLQPLVAQASPTPVGAPTPNVATSGSILQPPPQPAAPTAAGTNSPNPNPNPNSASSPSNPNSASTPPTSQQPPLKPNAPTASGGLGRLIPTLLKLGIVGGLAFGAWQLAAQGPIQLPEQVKGILQSVQSPTLSDDPAKAALQVAANEGPDSAVLAFCEQAFEKHQMNPELLITYQNALVRQGKLGTAQLCVLVPTGSQADQFKQGVAVAQRALSNSGQFVQIHLVEYPPEQLEHVYTQTSQRWVARDKETQVLILASKNAGAALKLKSAGLTTAIAGQDFSAEFDGIRTARFNTPAWGDWIRSAIGAEGGKLLWLSEQEPPSGVKRVHGPEALAKEIAALGDNKGKTLVLDPKQVSNLPSTAKLQLLILAQSGGDLEGLDKAPVGTSALVRVSPWNSNTATEFLRLSKSLFEGRQSEDLSSGQAFDSVCWCLTSPKEKYTGIFLEQDRDGKIHPVLPSLWNKSKIEERPATWQMQKLLNSEAVK